MVSPLTSYHSHLANYFSSKPLYLDEPTHKKPNTRKLVEQPWQQTKGELWDEVTETLCNLDFIQAKAAAKMTYELVNDFNAALEVIPDNAEDIREENERQARMDKYTRNLIACAKGEITTDELEIPKSVTPWTKEKTESEIKRVKSRPTKADLLKEFINFLGHENRNLQNYSSEFAHFTYQQAWNYAAEGPVGKAAAELQPEISKSLLRRTASTRPPWNPLHICIKTLNWHTDIVNSVSITSDGKFAISASSDYNCILWDLQSGKVLKTLKGHSAWVFGVSITPDGKRAISGSDDNTCILWDLLSGEAVKNLNGHSERINSVSITPDGKYAISGSYDQTCILWDLLRGKAIKTLKGHTACVDSVSITPDGKHAFSGSWDKTCILWDLLSGEAIKILKGHTSIVNAVSITPDGKHGISGSKDNNCILWNLLSGDAIKILKGHTSQIYAVSITPDGKQAFSGSRDTTCILWDLFSGNAVKTIKGHTASVSSVSLTPDGKHAISGSSDFSCILWDLQREHAITTPKGHTYSVTVVSTTSDGKRAISGSSDNTCILWDLVSGEAIKTLKGHTERISSISITPDGKHAISASLDNTCILWDLVSGEAIKTLSGHNSWVHVVSITPDGKRAISGSSDNTCILWDLISGEAIKTLKGHIERISAISITPDGKHAFSGSLDNTCILWNIVSGEAIKTLKGHKVGIEAVKNGSGNISRINVVSITPDGKHAISGSNDNTCILWELFSGIPLKTLNGHTKSIETLSITPDGKRAISGSSDNTCILWDLVSGEAIKTLKGHIERIKAISITPDGKHAISASWDNTCILWDLITGKQLSRFLTTSPIASVALFPQGIVLGCSSGVVEILNTDKLLLCPGIAITTIRQIWDFDCKKTAQPLADCPLCGHRFEPQKAIIYTIIQILQNASIKPDQSPFLELPDEAWAHPGLLGECPNCHEKLKYNPFFGSDMKGIVDYYSSQEREKQYQNKFDEAENAFKEENWKIAYNLYLKLVQQGFFDINYMRYNMALCQLNSLFTNNLEIINNINNLIKLLNDKGANNKAQIIADKLKERLEAIKKEEVLREKATAPWWKKLF